MKVVCIDDNAWPTNVPVVRESDLVKTGGVYKVVGSFEAAGYLFYQLDVDPNYGYWERCFAPVSDIDETEFVRNYNKQLV